MFFIDDEADDVDYEPTNRKIIYGNVTNMLLITCKVDFGAIDTDDTSCYVYCIIIFISARYTFQEELNIY